MTSKRNRSGRPSLPPASLVRGLLAACVVGSLSLGGCNRSPSNEAAFNAASASDQAARLTASAGDLRPKEEFVQSLKGKDDAELRAAADKAQKDIKADVQNAHGVWKNYLEQNSVSTDLATAADLLKKAEDSAAFSEADLKSSVQAQLGATQIAQARLQLASAQEQLLELADRAVDFQIAATYINELGAQAAVEEGRIKGNEPQDLSKLQATVEQRKGDVSKAQDAVKKLEAELADKQAQAAKIYADTDAAFEQAEGMKGTAAIDAAKKAVDARKQADQLTAEAAEMQPAIAHARTDLAAAQIQLADAESQLTSATSGNDQSAKRTQTATEQAKILHDQAKKLIDGETGLAAKYKAFTDLAEKVKTDAAKAEGFADKAAKSYADAVGSASKFSSRISEMNLETSDPLSVASKDQTAAALLKLDQAAAKEELARANLIGYTVAMLKSSAANAMAQAYKAAGEPQDTGLAAADKDKATNQDAALREFDAAATTAKSVADTAREGAPEKWLGYTLAAVALHGQYIINGQNKAAYQTAAQNAQQANPFLQLNMLAATPGAAPGNTAPAH